MPNFRTCGPAATTLKVVNPLTESVSMGRVSTGRGRRWFRSRRRNRRMGALGMAGALLASPLAAIAVTAANPAPVAAQATVASTPAGPAVAGGVNFGGYYEQTFYAMSPAQQSAVMAQVASLGITWIRVDVVFGSIEAEPGQFNWIPDSLVAAANAHGISVDALIDYPPGWALNADGTPNATDFAAFSRAAAAHLSAEGVHTYEIWNEPNLGSNWNGVANAAQYAALLQATYPAVKAGDPQATVISGGLAPASDDGTDISPETFVTQMLAAGAGADLDAVGMHPYSYPDMPETPDSWNPFYNLPQVHSEMVAAGVGNKKIWITEYGAPTQGPGAVTYSVQAAMLSAAFAEDAQQPWLGPLFVYNWRDDHSGDDYGLLDASGNLKPAATAVEQALGQQPFRMTLTVRPLGKTFGRRPPRLQPEGRRSRPASWRSGRGRDRSAPTRGGTGRLRLDGCGAGLP
jgi:hypothetical protein